jgi:DNA-binding response OmpR family regulator
MVCCILGTALSADGTLRIGGTLIHLTRREVALFRILSAKAGDVTTIAELMSTLFGDARLTKNALEAHMKNLRRKLSCTKHIQIIAVRNGYSLRAASDLSPADTLGL